jgi:hypothetical protein
MYSYYSTTPELFYSVQEDAGSAAMSSVVAPFIILLSFVQQQLPVGSHLVVPTTTADAAKLRRTSTPKLLADESRFLLVQQHPTKVVAVCQRIDHTNTLSHGDQATCEKTNPTRETSQCFVVA